MILALLCLGAPALADSISLSVTPEPVQELTSQIAFQAYAEEEAFAVVAVNSQGVPCGPDPAANVGEVVVPEIGFAGLWGRNLFEDSGNYTPSYVGAYTVCGWIYRYDGNAPNNRGPITASSSLPIEARAPHVSLGLSLPGRAQTGKQFVLNVDIESEVPRDLIVARAPLHGHECPANPAMSSTQRLIDTETVGGPWLERVNVQALAAGRYLFCAWADPPTDHGLDPQASTSLVVTVPRSHASRRATKHGHPHHPHRSRPASPRCPEFSVCQHGGSTFGP